MRLLVVEDEQDLAAAIARGLRRHGYAVDIANGAIVAEEKLRGNGYDLAILDWNLGDGSGLELCRRMVAGDLPTLEARRPRVLLLTARDNIDDRVAGLDAGADDYLVKPFAVDELTARVRALLRRNHPPGDQLAFADLVLDVETATARRGGRDLELTRREAELLELLLRNARGVVTRELALEDVWGGGGEAGANVVDRYVAYLRRKLGEPALIHTVRGVGFRLDT